MGISINVLKELVKFVPKANKLKNVLELGAQTIRRNSNNDYLVLSAIEHYKSQSVSEAIVASLSQRVLYAKNFYESLGYAYTAIDFDDEQFCIPADLNTAKAKDFGHKNMFSIVTNFGTTEHVSNQMNCFEYMHDTCEINGLMIHALPVSGYKEHGFFNYSLNFFYSLAKSNGYEILAVKVFSYIEDYAYTVRKEVDDVLVSNWSSNANRLLANNVDQSLFLVMKKCSDKPFSYPNQYQYKFKIDSASEQNQFQVSVNPLEREIENYLWLRYWNEDMNDIKQKLAEFVEMANGKIAIYGAGEYCRKVLFLLNDTEQISSIVDSESKNWGCRIRGIDIESPQKSLPNYQYVIIASKASTSQIKKNALEINQSLSICEPFK